MQEHLGTWVTAVFRNSICFIMIIFAVLLVKLPFLTANYKQTVKAFSSSQKNILNKTHHHLDATRSTLAN